MKTSSQNSGILEDDEALEMGCSCIATLFSETFCFICILECLYKINLESKDAVWFYGDETTILSIICKEGCTISP